MNAQIAVPPRHTGPALHTAHQPTLLELYRANPIAVRMQIARAARAERSADVNAATRRFFDTLKSPLMRSVARLFSKRIIWISLAQVENRR